MLSFIQTVTTIICFYILTIIYIYQPCIYQKLYVFMLQIFTKTYRPTYWFGLTRTRRTHFFINSLSANYYKHNNKLTTAKSFTRNHDNIQYRCDIGELITYRLVVKTICTKQVCYHCYQSHLRFEFVFRNANVSFQQGFPVIAAVGLI